MQRRTYSTSHEMMVLPHIMGLPEYVRDWTILLVHLTGKTPNFADKTQVSVVLTGVNPELGQTLASTGLTVWRAAEELARFMWEHRQV